MPNYIVNRPDALAIRRILDHYQNMAAAVIIRLAWHAGLLTNEIAQLQWGQVDFVGQELVLEDRSVPMSEEMSSFLNRLFWCRRTESSHVVVADRGRQPMAMQSISRLARRVLDQEGQTEVRLLDLRYDYIIRMMETEPWAKVSRVSGVNLLTLQQHFAPYAAPRPEAKKAERSQTSAQIDELRLQELLQTQGDTPASMAIRLVTQLGLSLEEISSLQWEQIDLTMGTLQLGDQVIHLPESLRDALQRVFVRDGQASPYVICSPRAKNKMDVPRLSRIVRAALIRADLDIVSFRTLYQSGVTGSIQKNILSYTREHGTISRSEAMELLGVSASGAYYHLHRMVEQGRLVRIGMKYYLPDTVVAPEDQADTILLYLTQEGGAYRGEIAELLHIKPTQCSVILKQMVSEGKLVQTNQRYHLKDA